MSDDPLAAFLLARIAEDEDAARTAGQYGPSWSWQQGYGEMCNDPECEFGELITDGAEDSPTVIMSVHAYDVHEGWQGAAHIARFDPARVLAECAAKRAIIAQAQPEHWLDDHAYGGYMEAIDVALYAMAAVYADHPEYRKEWSV